jgi:GNAT superfamily N-acetyltransferase
MMEEPVVIRAYQAADLPQVRALDARVGPYSPEDASEVEAMRARAAEAQRSARRWSPRFASPGSLDDIEGTYAAFWVAADGSDIVGMAGVRLGVSPKEVETARREKEWFGRTDIAELRRLRVAPEVRRRGVGMLLTQAVIDWSAERRCASIVLNTTTAQAPARSLYEKCGFVEVAKAFIGEFEFVWYELKLH